MKEWLTAREIAEERLPGLPTTESAAIRFADRNGWNDHPAHTRARSGRGGGLEYHFRLLPTLAQIAYCQKHMRLGAPGVTGEAPRATKDAKLSDAAAVERDARLAIIRKFAQFRSGLTLRQASALQVFTDKYNARSLHIEDWVLSSVPRLSKGSLKRWIGRARKGESLAFDRSKARKGKGLLDLAEDGRVRATILALLADNQHFSAEHIRDLVAAEYGETLAVPGRESRVPLPPIRTFQHFLKGLRSTEAVVLTRVQNPDRFRSVMAPRGTGSLAHIREPNALWQIDASPVDALCTDGRHAIYVCLDVATRRMTLLVSRTPRASAVGLLIRKAILAWGVPDLIKTDNGSDFVARDTKRLFASLGVEVELSDPYQPQQKAFVERAIGTFQKDCATMLPGFVGHSVADRKAIEDRKSFAARLGESDANLFEVGLSGEDLQGTVDRWVAVYEQRPHEGLKGQTPQLVAAQSRRPLRHVDERALDALLMTVPGGGTRRVTSRGIRVDGAHYMTPTILPGTEVLVRMDSADLGLVYAFTPDGGEFLGCGICPALSGIQPEEAAKTIKALQNEITARGAAAIKAEIRRIKKSGAYHERILAVREGRTGNVVPLPPRSEPHTTPQIRAAIAAAEATGPADAGALPARAAETHAALKAEASDEPVNVTPIRRKDTREQRFARARAIETRIDAGEAVAAADAVWLGRYQAGPEYRAMKAIFEDFGEQATH
ncbi:DDE-type integrase/transposase/recombinase [Afifella pfennigii]|uniref:DDE-type integrase/transposase/recombinase n=1 Tax=Afifella pfennigii TaxID=209897 RepID=UPI000478F4A6|nr:DDE-type integrase/transposase/recombinase [Afifella pfennigii]